MSVRNSLVELKGSYNSSQANVTMKLNNELAYFKDWKFDAKQKAIDEARAKIINEHKTKLETLKSSFQNEKKQNKLKLNQIKFPNLSSNDVNKKILGESQITAAHSFLAASKNNKFIVASIEEAMEIDRLDFAFTLIDSILSDDTSDMSAKDKLGPEKIDLINKVKQIYNGFPKRNEIDEMKKEIEDESNITEGLINEFQRKLEKGDEYIILPDLFPELNEKEMALEWKKLGEFKSITDQVRAKKALERVGKSI